MPYNTCLFIFKILPLRLIYRINNRKTIYKLNAHRLQSQHWETEMRRDCNDIADSMGNKIKELFWHASALSPDEAQINQCCVCARAPVESPQQARCGRRYFISHFICVRMVRAEVVPSHLAVRLWMEFDW